MSIDELGSICLEIFFSNYVWNVFLLLVVKTLLNILIMLYA